MTQLTWPRSTHAHHELWVDLGDHWGLVECVMRTEHYVTLIYPPGHPHADKTERIKWTTLDKRIATGAIIAVKRTTRGYTAAQAAAVDTLLNTALRDLFEHHPQLSRLLPRVAAIQRLLEQYEAYDPQLTKKEPANV